MHRIAAMPGGWNPQEEGVVYIEQDPAPIVILTAADTDIQVLARAWEHLPAGFPEIRAVNLAALQQQLTIDTYAEEVLEKAQAIVVRVLGGVGYWPYGLEVVQEISERTGAQLILLPGDDKPDPALSSRSTLPLTDVNQVWRYFIEGGIENLQQLLYFVANRCCGQNCQVRSPQVVEKCAVYGWSNGAVDQIPPSPPSKGGNSIKIPLLKGDLGGSQTSQSTNNPKVGIIFYRAHYLSGNTKPIDALCQALHDRHLTPIPIFISSLRDPDVQAELLDYFQPQDDNPIRVLLNTTSFSLISPKPLYPATPAADDTTELWQQLDVPVLQVILSGGGAEQWEAQQRGLSPTDTAMNVALPEVDGRIISRAVSFKAAQGKHPILQTEILGYEPISDRITFVADLTQRWVRMAETAVADRKVALILANYPNRDGRLANGVGLDTPASCVALLKAMQQQGYTISDIPESGDELIAWLTQSITNDTELNSVRPVLQTLSWQDYLTFFGALPEDVKQAMQERWGKFKTEEFAIAGIQLGNIFLGIQPSRGYDKDPTLNYHAPDLEPTHEYLAFYQWVRSRFGADAIVHVGKHGNLEWLPGKSVALSQTCYPEIAFGTMPHFYPFIVNDPGEGSQAKRRAQAVIIDHLTPPMTRAELYDDLQTLENLVDEYYEAMTLDPSRMKALREKIVEVLAASNLDQDLGITLSAESLKQGWESFEEEVLTYLDRSLCELKEAQIRDGLHILGQCPDGTQLRDLLIAIARHPQAGRVGLTRAIAEDSGLDFDPLMDDPAMALDGTWRNVGQAVEAIEVFVGGMVDAVIGGRSVGSEDQIPPSPPISSGEASPTKGGDLNKVPLLKGDLGGSQLTQPANNTLKIGHQTQTELRWLQTHLLPNLQKTTQETTALLHGLNGGYIPSAPSGAPTRGRSEVLPTGRNFYSVDIRAVPTESAWDVGRKAAEVLVERYTQENGEYPNTLGLSVWGTAMMRTGGDDLAQAFALMGVQPVWDGASRRVVDFEVLPLAVLGRPRVDVTLRISGFFRDAFPNLIDLFDQAVKLVAALDETPAENPLSGSVIQESAQWQAEGLSPEQAMERSTYRVFGSKPGAYGAGLQGLIESQNWTDDGDLANAYLNWSGYAYTGKGNGQSAPEAFAQRLTQMQVVLQNQDNREHDLLDSDDYYQFQGGMTAAVRLLSQAQPTTYFGDNAVTENPKVRSLKEEIAKVYRSRVVNPKWIAGVKRHGYKGAFEMSATVDFLFGYDATTNCVEDHMYQGVAEAYLFDAENIAFIQQSNAWAARDMSERLLEAHQRGLWENVSQETLERLRMIALDAEGEIESKIPVRSISL
ncbi:cobaltochelatase subunit CobN [filamentous cyanobacterium LEGE 11480]|uniref:Cobaltochelatase subunit CobN n=1 Tax=Romeriopsis navalis LEGE 11480 TaxID=2777977 RepID=A0A928VKC7_9CYAN|nr:cobaltochelatase subunit CobN [Romeriopsis navalis]MBE9030208.1 cobaltochelatase subunit CobN [Romeriopsis navalis LEGE 11480]